MVLKDRKNEYTRYRRVKSKGKVWLKEEKEGCWAKKLWEIDESVLIPRMQTMGCQIADIKVICEIIEWCDGRMRKEVRPGNRVIGVEFCV